jgi:urate oxidase
VIRTRTSAPSITAGLENLIIMKTANSGFEGFIRDAHTTLPETGDRLLGTALSAQWGYTSSDLDFATARTTTRTSMLKAFAEHDSRSVQHTLFAMGKAALEANTSISDITLTMPNKHCLLVDLTRFGKTNHNEIFVPTEEPYGYIEATIRRED